MILGAALASSFVFAITVGLLLQCSGPGAYGHYVSPSKDQEGIRISFRNPRGWRIREDQFAGRNMPVLSGSTVYIELEPEPPFPIMPRWLHKLLSIRAEKGIRIVAVSPPVRGAAAKSDGRETLFQRSGGGHSQMYLVHTRHRYTASIRYKRTGLKQFDETYHEVRPSLRLQKQSVPRGYYFLS
jgi:hypothetical protein